MTNTIAETSEAVEQSTEAQAAEANEQAQEAAQDDAQDSTNENTPEVDSDKEEADNEDSEDNAEEDRSVDELKQEIKDLRAEAAKYRKQRRELQDALAKAKSPEEVEKAVAELEAKNQRLELELTRTRVARELSIPDALVGRLQGSTEEELREDASALLAALGSVNPKAKKGSAPSGGLDPEAGGEDAFDYKAWAREQRARRGF